MAGDKQKRVRFDDFPEREALRKKLVQLQLQKSEVAKARQAGESQWAAAQARDKVQDKADALVRGDEGDTPTISAERLEDLRTQELIVGRAIEMVRDEMKRCEAKASREICESLRQ